MKYLIFRDDGIGDLIISTPLIKIIKDYDKDANITLIYGARNFEYANHYKNEGLIEEVISAPTKNGFLNKLLFIIKIRKIKADCSFILNPKNINYVYAHLSKSRKVYGFLTLNTSSRNITRYRPNKILINFLLNKYIKIDATNNFANSQEVHWSSYYISLVSEALMDLNLAKETKFINDQLKYVQLKLTDQEKKLLQHLRSSCIDTNNINILHLDEKWDRSNWSNKEISYFISKIINEIDGFLVMTQGLYSTNYNKFLFNEFNFQKIKRLSNTSIYKSKINKKFFLIKPTNMTELTILIKNSKLVIEHHGGLAHIASMYNKKVVDLIYPSQENFLKKWMPRSTDFIQIKVTNKKYTLKNVLGFIKK